MPIRGLGSSSSPIVISDDEDAAIVDAQLLLPAAASDDSLSAVYQSHNTRSPPPYLKKTKGYRMALKMGYVPGRGLGRVLDGCTEIIHSTKRKHFEEVGIGYHGDPPHEEPDEELEEGQVVEEEIQVHPPLKKRKKSKRPVTAADSSQLPRAERLRNALAGPSKQRFQNTRPSRNISGPPNYLPQNVPQRPSHHLNHAAVARKSDRPLPPTIADPSNPVPQPAVAGSPMAPGTVPSASPSQEPPAPGSAAGSQQEELPEVFPSYEHNPGPLLNDMFPMNFNFPQELPPFEPTVTGDFPTWPGRSPGLVTPEFDMNGFPFPPVMPWPEFLYNFHAVNGDPFEHPIPSETSNIHNSKKEKKKKLSTQQKVPIASQRQVHRQQIGASRSAANNGVFTQPMERIPDPLRTLVLNRIPPKYRTVRWIKESWAAQIVSRPTTLVEVDFNAGKAIVEFVSVEAAQVAYSSKRLTGKGKKGIVAIWFDPVGAQTVASAETDGNGGGRNAAEGAAKGANNQSLGEFVAQQKGISNSPEAVKPAVAPVSAFHDIHEVDSRYSNVASKAAARRPQPVTTGSNALDIGHTLTSPSRRAISGSVSALNSSALSSEDMDLSSPTDGQSGPSPSTSSSNDQFRVGGTLRIGFDEIIKASISRMEVEALHVSSNSSSVDIAETAASHSLGRPDLDSHINSGPSFTIPSHDRPIHPLPPRPSSSRSAPHFTDKRPSTTADAMLAEDPEAAAPFSPTPPSAELSQPVPTSNKNSQLELSLRQRVLASRKSKVPTPNILTPSPTPSLPRSPVNDSPAALSNHFSSMNASMEDLAVSFINESIEAIRAVPAPPLAPPPPPSAALSIKQQLEMKQHRLEHCIAQSKALMAKLTTARTKPAREVLMKELRDISRLIDDANAESAELPTPAEKSSLPRCWPCLPEESMVLELSDEEEDAGE